ncbi:SCO2522 family protein [Streptomyces sp. NPDC088254]|uniref:SCO2522 family protein n=1 Tax=Streptomyces sp. NPDC088254 TaxID=3365847 RepID=UPI0038014BAA
MSGPGTVFRETSAQPRTESVPYSHLSLELGHLYMEDFVEGPDRLRRHFAAVRPWVDAARAGVGPLPAGRRPRISTCFLIDDYFSRLSTPAELVPPLLEAAAESGLTIDYLARESGCAGPALAGPGPAGGSGRRDRAVLAEAVLHRLVESPPPGSNGFRPPVSRTGWLTNGRRAPSRRTSAALDATGAVWEPPSETGARGHSVFMDVELWSGPEDERTWSCAFLASVWQLVRLGLLRDNGQAVLTPAVWDDKAFPADWDALPPVVRLNPLAPPFTAYATCSILPARFLPVEHAVRVVLDQVHVEEEALRQVAERSAGEGVTVPAGIVDRTSYVFPPGL